MGSLIAGYEYDIFISYRHNDNRSGWVTDFVNALQEELAATIKEPLSIYFDKNPHDGLLETHQVDKSLEGKLKCLIFIPIISQTYCDTKSFAWQHEFVVFNKLSQEDQFGRDIKLSNGNVASRILPIKIHDIDVEDKTTIENEIGGVLRAIEFIYKEAGVNRPLKPTDSKTDNQNKTDYRNQVNKVANAIKELIHSFKNPIPPTQQNAVTEASKTKEPKRTKSFLAIGASMVLLAVAGYILYPKLISTNKQTELLDKSIAVLPFTDLSPTQDQEYFGDGMAEAIINGLGQVNNLKVIARSSSFQFKGKNESLLTIGNTLNVATALEGSVTKSGDRIRVRATLTKTDDGTQLWSETFDRDLNDYLLIQDEITSKIVTALRISFYGQLRPSQRLSSSEEAIKLYQQGRYFHDRNGDGDSKLASDYFFKAVQLDTTFALAWAYLATASDYDVEKFRKYARKAIDLNPNLGDAIVNEAGILFSDLNFDEEEKELRKALTVESENPRVVRNVGLFLSYLGYYSEGIQLSKRAVDLDPLQSWSYFSLTHALAVNGNFNEALASWIKENQISNRKGISTKVHLLVLSGQPKEAFELLDKISSEEDKLFLSAAVSFSLNQSKEAEGYLRDFKHKYTSTNPHAVSELLVFFGNKEEALRILDAVVLKPITAWSKTDEWFRFALFLRASPYLIPLRDDPRFKEICKKYKYPDIE